MFENKGFAARESRGTRRLLALCVIAVAVFSSTAGAAPVAEVKGLKPETRDAVRGVGQALLRANRSYIPDPAVATLRNNVGTVRGLVKALAEPLTTKTIHLKSIAPASSGAARIQGVPVSPEAAWRQDKALEISRLRSAVADLRKRCQAFRKKTTGVHSAVIAPVTPHLLARLERLDKEIESALNSPETERHQRMRDLVATLSPRESNSSVHNVAEKNISPTIATRTQHRRTWQ